MRHMGLNSITKRLGKKVKKYNDPTDIVTSVNRTVIYSTRDFEWSILRTWLLNAIVNKGLSVYYNKRSKNFMVTEKYGVKNIPHGYAPITEKLLYRMEDN